MTKDEFKSLKFKGNTIVFVSSGQDITAKIVTYPGADATFEKVPYKTGRIIKVKAGSFGDVTLQEVRTGGAFKAN